MATRFVCDMCGKEVPVPTALSKLSMGDELLAEVCLNCGYELKQAITAKKTATAKEQAKVEVPAAPAAEPVEPAEEKAKVEAEAAAAEAPPLPTH